MIESLSYEKQTGEKWEVVVSITTDHGTIELTACELFHAAGLVMQSFRDQFEAQPNGIKVLIHPGAWGAL